MKYDHFRNVLKLKTGGAGAIPPLHVFGDQNSSKWPDFVEIVSPYGKISGSGISVVLYVKLVSIVKNALICFDGAISSFVVPPDLNIAAQNGSFGRSSKCTDGSSKPIGVCTTIGVYEAKYIGPGILSPAISCGTRPRLEFVQQTDFGVP
jgi:hypothetical protein